MLESLVQQAIEGRIPSSAVECRGCIVMVQDVRFWFATIVVIVVTTL